MQAMQENSTGPIYDLGGGIYDFWSAGKPDGGISVSVRVVDRGLRGCDINVTGIARVVGTESSALKRVLDWDLKNLMQFCERELSRVLAGQLSAQPSQDGPQTQLG
jgi:hypothetical protein